MDNISTTLVITRINVFMALKGMYMYSENAPESDNEFNPIMDTFLLEFIIIECIDSSNTPITLEGSYSLTSSFVDNE